jgi:dolichyl-phosphooligosaccharide-protein glycotransferase
MSASPKSRNKKRPGAAEARPPKKPQKISGTSLLMAGILLLGLAVRLLPALYCVIGNHVVLLGTDSYYHMRRIFYTILHFPFTNNYDSYINFPYGYPVDWPPLFDILGAATSLLAGLGNPDHFLVELISSVLPPLLGVASIVLIYYIVKGAINEKVALIAAFIFAVLPAGVFRSLFSLVDHHALEVFVMLAVYLLFIRAVSAAKRSGLGVKDMDHARPLIYAVLSGIAIAIAIFAWEGALIFISVLVAYAFVQYVYDMKNNEGSRYLTAVGLISSLVPLAIIFPMTLVGGQTTSSASYLSWFHVYSLGSVAIFFLAMDLMSGILRKRDAPWYSLPAIAIVLGVTAALVLKLALPQFIHGIEIGLLYLSGMDKVMSTVSEVEPLFITLGKLSPAIPWAYFSFAGPLAILGLAIYILKLKGRKPNNIEIFLLVWTALVIVLGLMQKRFINILGVNVALFAGYALYEILALAGMEEYLNPTKKPSSSRSGSISPALMGACVAAILLLVPLLLNSISLAATPEYYLLDWNDASSWVRDNTPGTSYTFSADMGTSPEYGIMSWWDYGNFILYGAERPVVANNFQTGVSDAAHFFTTQNEAIASAVLNKRHAKYVMLDYRMGSPFAGTRYGIFEDMAYLANQDPMSYHNASVKYLNMSANDKYFGTMYSQLFLGNGCGGNLSGKIYEGLEHYRLRYMTFGTDPVKVFEYVQGANITGKAPPGSAVELKLKIASQYGQGIYYQVTEAGPDGRYVFIVPYPTSSTSFIKTDDSYYITQGSNSTRVAVPDSSVTSGGTIEA